MAWNSILLEGKPLLFASLEDHCSLAFALNKNSNVYPSGSDPCTTLITQTVFSYSLGRLHTTKRSSVIRSPNNKNYGVPPQNCCLCCRGIFRGILPLLLVASTASSTSTTSTVASTTSYYYCYLIHFYSFTIFRGYWLTNPYHYKD